MKTVKVDWIDRSLAIKWCQETFGPSITKGYDNTITTNWCVFGETFGFNTDEQLQIFSDKWALTPYSFLYHYVMGHAQEVPNNGSVHITDFFSSDDEETCNTVIEYITSIPGSKIDIVDEGIIYSWYIPENI